MKKYLLIVMMSISATGMLSAQGNTPAPVKKDEKKPPQKSLPSLSLGAGVLSFHGNVGKGSASSFSSIRAGYQFSVEQRLARMIGISLQAAMGKLSKGNRSVDPTMNQNFENSFMQFGLGLAFHFDNDAIMPADYPVAPYIFTGFNYFMGSIATDSTDANSNKYYYWDDGSIRDLPQVAGNEFIANYMKRDYTYETALADVTTFSIPVGLGFKLKVHKNIEATINFAWHITMSPTLDNSDDGKNDPFMFNFVTLKYNFGRSKSSEEKDRYSNVDWNAIMNMDEDADGVEDAKDYCQGTDKGIKVDGKGCPPDKDEDGVPDHKDKEPNSKKGIAVDESGVMLTDARIAELERLKDSLSNVREQVVVQNPTTETLKEIDKQIVEQKKTNETQLGVTSKLPEEFKSADSNKDGVISSSEINGVIDMFFDGSGDYTVEKIHRLIDFFFEQ